MLFAGEMIKALLRNMIRSSAFLLCVFVDAQLLLLSFRHSVFATQLLSLSCCNSVVVTQLLPLNPCYAGL